MRRHLENIVTYLRIYLKKIIYKDRLKEVSNPFKETNFFGQDSSEVPKYEDSANTNIEVSSKRQFHWGGCDGSMRKYLFSLIKCGLKRKET
jgi:hypothetical protein